MGHLYHSDVKLSEGFQRFQQTTPEKKPTTAEPFDKNRLGIFQPTLGFLSAIGAKYGNEGTLKSLMILMG
jgi:hypothetical protein